MIGSVSPDRATCLEELTPKMARGLVRCQATTVLVAEVERSGIHPSTMAALIRHGLVEQGQDARARPVWRPSPRGAQIIARAAPRLLAARSQHGYTTRASQAMHAEPEVLDPSAVELERARDAHEARRAGVDEQLLEKLGKLRAHRQLLQQAAFSRGIDVRSEMRMMDRAQDGVERKIREQRAALRKAA